MRLVVLLFAVARGGRTSVYVKRASGHSGSKWIAENLAASNLSTFFQDGGLCAGRCCLPTGAPNVTGADRLHALARLYERGCGCMYARDGRRGADYGNERCLNCGRKKLAPAAPRANESRCQWGEYCLGACAAANAVDDCLGVATVGAIPDDPPRLDGGGEKCGGARRWCLNKAGDRNAWHKSLAAGTDDLRLVTWDRDNSVKHALSFLKHNHHCDCASPYLANHAKVDEAALVAKQNPFAFLYVTPGRLLAKATEKALGRLALIREFDGLPVAYAARYEAFQRDEAGEMARLLDALGLPAPPRWAKDELVKLTPEDLRALVVNFDQLNATLAPWPCLRAMLHSAIPETLDACRDDELPTPRQVAAALAPVPSMSSPKTTSVVLDCSSDAAKEHPKLPKHVDATADALCAAARTMGRALHGTPDVDVCVLP